MATSGQIEKIVTVLTAMYPNDVAFLTKEQMAARTVMYCRLLADVDTDLLGLAVDQYIAGGGKDYPTVKQLRDMALALVQAADDAPDAATAWRMACKAISPMGYGFEFSAAGLHPRVVKAVELYGMSRIGGRLEEHAGTDFAQWRGLYESLVHRADEQARWLPQVRERVLQLRAEMDAQKPAQIEAPADEAPAPSPRPAGGMVRISEVLAFNAAPPLTKAQLDRRSAAAALLAKRDRLRDELRNETDEAKRHALEATIDGITRSVAQYEVAQ